MAMSLGRHFFCAGCQRTQRKTSKVVLGTCSHVFCINCLQIVLHTTEWGRRQLGFEGLYPHCCLCSTPLVWEMMSPPVTLCGAAAHYPPALLPLVVASVKQKDDAAASGCSGLEAKRHEHLEHVAQGLTAAEELYVLEKLEDMERITASFFPPGSGQDTIIYGGPGASGDKARWIVSRLNQRVKARQLRGSRGRPQKHLTDTPVDWMVGQNLTSYIDTTMSRLGERLELSSSLVSLFNESHDEQQCFTPVPTAAGYHSVTDTESWTSQLQGCNSTPQDAVFDVLRRHPGPGTDGAKQLQGCPHSPMPCHDASVNTDENHSGNTKAACLVLSSLQPSLAGKTVVTLTDPLLSDSPVRVWETPALNGGSGGVHGQGGRHGPSFATTSTATTPGSSEQKLVRLCDTPPNERTDVAKTDFHSPASSTSSGYGAAPSRHSQHNKHPPTKWLRKLKHHRDTFYSRPNAYDTSWNNSSWHFKNKNHLATESPTHTNTSVALVVLAGEHKRQRSYSAAKKRNKALLWELVQSSKAEQQAQEDARRQRRRAAVTKPAWCTPFTPWDMDEAPAIRCRFTAKTPILVLEPLQTSNRSNDVIETDDDSIVSDFPILNADAFFSFLDVPPECPLR